MKTYIIELLTKTGIIREIYTGDPKNADFELLSEFEIRMKNKHGDFIMIKSEEL